MCWSGIKSIALTACMAVVLCSTPPPAISQVPAPPPFDQARELGSFPQVRLWQPESYWCTVVCLHGLGFYSGSFSSLGERLKEDGVRTVALDLPGLGSKQSERFDFERALTESASILRHLKANDRSKPVFVLGESMGGALALQLAARCPDLVDGVVAAVPPGKRRKSARSEFELVAELLSGRIPLKKEVFSKSFPKGIAPESDPSSLKSSISRAEAWEFFQLMRSTPKLLKSLRRPVLIVQGYEDRLIDPRAAFKFFNKIAAEDKDFVLIGTRNTLSSKKAASRRTPSKYCLHGCEKNPPKI
jgi:alpha-beta hydrolase superfamily lysophospholipase